LAGWKDFEESCYYFSTERMSWREAKEICDDRGAHLVIINSEQEQVSRPLPKTPKSPFLGFQSLGV